MADVFISYSRRDQAFVRRLHAALKEAGREIWVDWEGIPPTAKWMDEVRAAIDTADAFIFVVSPDSAGSPVCGQEAEHAAGSGKRIVPIVWRDVPDGQLPEAVSAHNWLFMRETDDFDAGLATLTAALDTDLEWVHAHTRLVTRAREWETNRRERSYLLRGRDLDAAERQLASAERRNPSPTPLQTEYVFASRQAERRGQRIRSFALSGGLVAALILAGFALVQLQDAITQRGRAEDATRQADANATEADTQRQQANANATEANTQRQAAEAQRQETERQRQAADAARTQAQARELAAAADAQLTRDPELSLLLATRAVETYAAPDTDRGLRVALEQSLIRERFSGHTAGVTSVAYGRSGALLASAGGDGIRIWDVATNTQMRELHPPTGIPKVVVFLPGGQLLVTGQDDGSLVVWSVDDGQVIKNLAAHTAAVSDLDLSHDGSRLLSVGYDGVADIWDTSTWTVAGTVPGKADLQLYSGAFSLDGSQIALGGRDAVVRLYDSDTGAELRQFVGHVEGVVDIAFSPDGSQMATGGSDRTARLWDVASGTQLAILRGHTDQVGAVAFDSTGQTLYTVGYDGTVRIWDTAAAHELSVIPGGAGTLQGLAVAPDGKRLATGAADGTVRVWVTRALEPKLVLATPLLWTLDVTFSPDATKLASAGEDGAVRVYDAASGALLQTLQGAGAGQMHQVSFDPSGDRLVGGSGHDATIWDVATGKQLLDLAGHDSTVFAATFDPTGTRVLTASPDQTARIWDAATGTQLSVIRAPVALFSATYSADGRNIIAGGEDGAIRIWEAADGHLLQTLTGHSGVAVSVAVSRDGTRLASVAEDGVRVWELPTGRLLLDLKQPFGYAYRANFSPDGTQLVTGSSDGAAHVWDLAQDEVLADIPSDPQDVRSVAYGPERQILVGGGNGTAHLFICDMCGPSSEMVALAHARATRDLTPEERAALLHETASASPSPQPSPSASPSPEPSPNPSGSPEPSPTPSPTLAPDDVCIVGQSACDLLAGDYRPSLFEPAISFHLDADMISGGQSRGGVSIGDPNTGNQANIFNSAFLYGAKGDSAVLLAPGSAGFLGYLRTLPWLDVTADAPIVVGGRNGVEVRITSSIRQPLPLFYSDPYPNSWTVGEHMRMILIDVTDKEALIVIGEDLGAGGLDPIFDSLIQSIRFR